MLPAGSKMPGCWWTNVELLVYNDFNLAAGRYKPQESEPTLEEDPVQLIREVLLIERKIVKGLEKLMTEVEAAG
jgi:type I restriction enzyme M protein